MYVKNDFLYGKVIYIRKRYLLNMNNEMFTVKSNEYRDCSTLNQNVMMQYLSEHIPAYCNTFPWCDTQPGKDLG